jgi:transcription termination/antitermination protein NusA
VKPIEGITEEMLDKMGALGMISVFDIEEVGAEVLEQELGMPAELADRVVEECASQAKVVAEQQQKDKEEAERKRLEDESTAEAVLGGADEPFIEPDAQAESAAASILGIGTAEAGDGTDQQRGS